MIPSWAVLSKRLEKFTIVSNDQGCKLVIGANANGYAQIEFSEKKYTVSRLIVAIRDNLEYSDRSWMAIHKCDHKNCILSEHLLEGDDSTNMYNAVNKRRHPQSRKTHCPKGHEYTPENTFPSGLRGRRCKECARAHDRKRRPRGQKR